MDYTNEFDFEQNQIEDIEAVAKGKCPARGLCVDCFFSRQCLEEKLSFEELQKLAEDYLVGEVVD